VKAKSNWDFAVESSREASTEQAITIGKKIELF
jgi:hypothetical protein